MPVQQGFLLQNLEDLPQLLKYYFKS